MGTIVQPYQGEVHRKPDDAELFVYTALRRLPDAYQVFVNPRLNKQAAVDPFDRPLSFVVLHPEKGLMAVAMKVGEIVEETNGLLSQYQPHRQLYKIMDPVKQAKTAFEVLANDYDPDVRALVPSGVIAVFPDTMRVEFADPKANYFFKEQLDSPRFLETLEEIFPDPPPGVDVKRIRTHLEAFAAYLRKHSDHHFELRDRTRVTPVSAIKKTPPEGYKVSSGVRQGASQGVVSPAIPSARQMAAPAKSAAVAAPNIRQAVKRPVSPSRAAAPAAPPVKVASAPLQRETPRPPAHVAGNRIAPTQAPPVRLAHPQWRVMQQQRNARLPASFWIGVVLVAAAFIVAVFMFFRHVGIFLR